MSSQSSRPQFHSQIPQHLLANATPEMAYLLNEVSKNSQVTEYLLDKRFESGIILDSINKKLDYTNGAIGEAKRAIHALEEKAKEQDKIKADIKQIVATKRFISKWCFNRYAFGFIFIVIVGILKVATNPELAGFFLKIVGLG